MISIIGPGAVGLTLADALSRAGVRVEVVARKERLHDLQARGLWVKRLGASIAPIKVPIVGEVSPETRFVLLTPKTYALPHAIDMYGKQLPHEAVVVACQNGITADATVRKLLPGRVTYGAVMTFTATSLRPGEVELHAENGEKPAIALGSDDAERNEVIRESELYELLSRGLDVARVVSLEGARWTKLIVNLNMALFAATGHPARRLYAHRYGPWLALTAMREGLALAKASSVRLAAIPWASPMLMKLVGGLPDGPAVALFKRQVDKILAEDVDTLGSTLQSIKRGEPTEIEELNGAVVRLAKPLGVPTPLNAAVTQAVNAQGRGRGPATIEELCEAAVQGK